MKDSELQRTDFHYFASSCLTWQTGSDLQTLISKMRKEDYGRTNTYKAKICNIWLVPKPENAKYEINYYAPQVEGAILIFSHNHETKRTIPALRLMEQCEKMAKFAKEQKKDPSARTSSERMLKNLGDQGNA